jgi:hypothetical protein
MKWTCRLSLFALLMCASRAGAVGWGPTDFLITGAPNFPDRIGVFDQNFALKGYLETNFLGVQGMDFDAQGRLVVTSSLVSEVRVYDPSGAKVGGFTQSTSPMLVTAGDLKVASNGDYMFGTTANGVREFAPDGTMMRQYGNGSSAGVAVIPGNRLWSGGLGPTVRIFDTISGAQIGTFTADQQVNSGTMQYSPLTNTVLMDDPDRDAGGVYERDLNGALLRQFHMPVPQVGINSVTRGPGGYVFGAAGKYRIDHTYFDVADWQSDARFVSNIAAYPVEISTGRILWAGIVPEPISPTLIGGLICLFFSQRTRTRGRTNRLRH